MEDGILANVLSLTLGCIMGSSFLFFLALFSDSQTFIGGFSIFSTSSSLDLNSVLIDIRFF